MPGLPPPPSVGPPRKALGNPKYTQVLTTQEARVGAFPLPSDDLQQTWHIAAGIGIGHTG